MGRDERSVAAELGRVAVMGPAMGPGMGRARIPRLAGSGLGAWLG